MSKSISSFIDINLLKKKRLYLISNEKKMLETILSKDIYKQIHQEIPPEIFNDLSHDYRHSLRVSHNALTISKSEGGDAEILVSAALLHDIGNVEKNNPQAHLNSEFSSQKASQILSSVNFSSKKIHTVLDAIMCSQLYSPDDPFLKNCRTPDNKKYIIDHFYIKLFKLPDMMQTKTGKKIAQKRILIMKQFF